MVYLMTFHSKDQQHHPMKHFPGQPVVAYLTRIEVLL